MESDKHDFYLAKSNGVLPCWHLIILLQVNLVNLRTLKDFRLIKSKFGSILSLESILTQKKGKCKSAVLGCARRGEANLVSGKVDLDGQNAHIVRSLNLLKTGKGT